MTKPTIESKCEKTRCASVDSVNNVASTHRRQLSASSGERDKNATPEPRGRAAHRPSSKTRGRKRPHALLPKDAPLADSPLASLSR